MDMTCQLIKKLGIEFNGIVINMYLTIEMNLEQAITAFKLLTQCLTD